ncbi:YihY/virulence factor BrkB family protein [Sulfitobacter sp. F26169L]|uniref:YihY/virulence factor BrkB family protein n=1 Tax=Sulfitobacter sp. F26169L TaxID=2996015 RepID=UPI002260DBEA|nr:YihY/virulence factor BrkB family protein [Sulfitobacter sp. F26169L]MCX7568196.1 YihY/virulence factor BrkB family protein [Sulfitobacter sp. F26169L]
MARGRNADVPTEITVKGWKDIILRVKDEMAADHVGLIAAGIAFYALLAIFPAITALMALGGLILEPADVTAQLKSLTEMIPKEAAQIILDQAVAVAGSEQTGLGVAFVIGLLLAIYSASKGMGSLMEGLNVAYDEEETRGFIKKTLWTLGLTVFLILGLILGLLAALAVPAMLNFLALPDWLETILALSRWVILALMTVVGLAVLYRYGPSRDDAEWKWLSLGAIAACVIWIAASVAFSIYVRNFGSYNESFGSMAGVIILLMWLWISAFIVLMGAELNAEVEAQTTSDTTVGPDEPMGSRGAEKADKLGDARGS